MTSDPVAPAMVVAAGAFGGLGYYPVVEIVILCEDMQRGIGKLF